MIHYISTFLVLKLNAEYIWERTTLLAWVAQKGGKGVAPRHVSDRAGTRVPIPRLYAFIVLCVRLTIVFIPVVPFVLLIGIVLDHRGRGINHLSVHVILN